MPYLPCRILGGAITPEGLDIVLRERKVFVPWEKLRLLCLGIIREPSVRSYPTMYTQIKKAFSKMFAKKALSSEREEEQAAWRQTIYVELFARDHEMPFRIDSSNLNYRNFLERIDYISENNFRNFLMKLCGHLPASALDDSLTAYLSGPKEGVPRFADVYEFQSACKEKWLKCQAANR